YRNSSDRMVIVRCIGPDEFFLERVVFPFELLSFLAPAESVVQIWTHSLGGAELRESIAVEDLCVDLSGLETAAASLDEPETVAAPIGNAPAMPMNWQKAS
ncbi:MAG: hypothetical protein RLZZ247_1150, partial [Cyanobacteriota bacterium]